MSNELTMYTISREKAGMSHMLWRKERNNGTSHTYFIPLIGPEGSGQNLGEKKGCLYYGERGLEAFRAWRLLQSIAESNIVFMVCPDKLEEEFKKQWKMKNVKDMPKRIATARKRRIVIRKS